MVPPSPRRQTLSEPSTPCCHDLAQFTNLFGCCQAAQCARRATEKTSEARRKVAMAGKSRIEGDGGQVLTTGKHGRKGQRQTLLQDIAVDRGTNHLAEKVAQMERR